MYWCEIEIVESYITLKLKNGKLIEKKVVTRRVSKYFGDWPRFKNEVLTHLTFNQVWGNYKHNIEIGGFARYNVDARYSRFKALAIYIEGSDVK